MPRIPGCTKALASLVSANLQAGQTPKSAQQAFERALPAPYWMTRKRLESRVNLIQAAMGQGGKSMEKQTAGAVQVSDEAAMLKRVKAKL